MLILLTALPIANCLLQIITMDPAKMKITSFAAEELGLETAAGSSPFYSWRSVRFAGFLSAGYLLLSYLLIGFKTDQLVLLGLFNGLYFISAGTRKLILGFSIFIVYWIIFDYMKAFPNYRYQPVHISSLYQAEKQLFGISTAAGTITPNEYFAIHHHTWLDVLTGIFYLCWVPVPLLFAAILFFRNRKQFYYFSLSFLLVNLIGFVIYYAYPAAPPWYVQQYGFRFNPATPGNSAGLARFDAFFHAPVFAGLYSKSSNVFAAMPSLHAAYPLLVFFYGMKYRFGYWNILFFIIGAGIWFSAVYNGHHYLLDVLAGIGCGLAGILLFHWIAEQTAFGKRLAELWER